MKSVSEEKSAIKILCLEDSPSDAELICEMLADAGYAPVMDLVETEKEFVSHLSDCNYDLIISDFQLAGFNAFASLRLSIEMAPDVPFICVSGSIGEETAIELLKNGAMDYVLKERLERLPAVVIRALAEAKEKKARLQAEDALREYSLRLEEMVEARTCELKEAHEHIVKQGKLAILGQLAGGVGHELRNPLAAIKNASYYLKMAVKEPSADIKETLQILEREVASSEKIISSLLEYARPPQPAKTTIDVPALIRDALSRNPASTLVEICLMFEENLPFIQADSGQIFLVMENLILNALQSMPDGGILSISARKKPEGQLEISISDTGTGIPADNFEKIFEPLFTTRAKGIGLGLPISRMLVEAHEGTLLLKSEPGKGSVFTIMLPASAEEGK